MAKFVAFAQFIPLAMVLLVDLIRPSRPEFRPHSHQR